MDVVVVFAISIMAYAGLQKIMLDKSQLCLHAETNRLVEFIYNLMVSIDIHVHS